MSADATMPYMAFVRLFQLLCGCKQIDLAMMSGQAFTQNCTASAALRRLIDLALLAV